MTSPDEIKKVQDLIDTLKSNGATSVQQMLDTLCDGAALASMGYNDQDQETIESAYALLREQL